MLLIRDLKELAEAAAALGRADGLGGVLTPTMGALHEGHAALIRSGVELAAREGMASGCFVSIFVNPTQFNDRADFDRYPRTLEVDLEICRRAGASGVFAPRPDTVYPPLPAPPIGTPPLPEAATKPGLEDAYRPGHFAGVCQVVKRLFDLMRPEAAVFGEKDWQQLQVVSAMARGLGQPIRIIAHPTLRDADGLAMSSRNRFLSEPERSAALAIPRALLAAQRVDSAPDAERRMHRMLADAGLDVEYAVVRDAESLGPIQRGRSARALIAARAGRTRLIDNAEWTDVTGKGPKPP